LKPVWTITINVDESGSVSVAQVPANYDVGLDIILRSAFQVSTAYDTLKKAEKEFDSVYIEVFRGEDNLSVNVENVSPVYERAVDIMLKAILSITLQFVDRAKSGMLDERNTLKLEHYVNR